MWDDLLSPTHLIVLLILALLIFGPKRLPELGSSLGKTIRDFKQALTVGPASTSSAPLPTKETDTTAESHTLTDSHVS